MILSRFLSCSLQIGGVNVELIRFMVVIVAGNRGRYVYALGWVIGFFFILIVKGVSIN